MLNDRLKKKKKFVCKVNIGVFFIVPVSFSPLTILDCVVCTDDHMWLIFGGSGQHCVSCLVSSDISLIH